MLVYLAAAVCLAYGLRAFMQLCHLDLYSAIETYGSDFYEHTKPGNGTWAEYIYRVFYLNFIALITALLLVLTYSLIVCRKNSFGWYNSLIPFIACFLLFRITDLFFIIRSVLGIPFYLFSSFMSDLWNFLLNGALFTGVAAWLLFSKATNRFIAKERQAENN